MKKIVLTSLLSICSVFAFDIGSVTKTVAFGVCSPIQLYL